MITTTARDLVQDAFQLIRVYGVDEPLADADAWKGLTSLNEMLDSWSNERLMCYAFFQQTLVMIPGQSQYTIGPGGFVNSARPLQLKDGPGAAYVQDITGNQYPVEVVQLDQWNLIGLKDVNSNIPNTLFYDPQYPLGIINLFPQPNIGYTLGFTSWLQLSEFNDLTISLSLPIGYVRAIKTNLALELEPYYPSAVVSDNLRQNASVSKGNVKRTNTVPVVSTYDDELISRAKSTYNIYADRGG